MAIVIAGVLFVVGLLIFSNVSNSTSRIIDPNQVTVVNESVTITITLDTDTNSTVLSQLGFITNSEVVRNGTKGSDHTQLTRDTDYKIGLHFGASGELPTQANFTLLGINNETPPNLNGTPLFITYNRNQQSSAQLSTALIQTTVLDSFSLGVIALIVLAAVVILAVLFRLGTQ